MTLTGPSGIGKTRLSRQVAIEVTDSSEPEGGAWFCSLETARDPWEVEATVARLMGVPGESGSSLIRAIGNRGRTLLVLDNLDSVAHLCRGLIGSWLDFCVELQMIATSIVPIGIEGEARFDLGPLESQDAMALYLQRARHALAGREQLEEEREVVEELVGRLDRIPLAIELAAARVQVFPPRELLSRFSERFDLLRSPQRGRHGSLLEAMSATWELLSFEEQEGLARMSVFEGGFDLEAATAVLGGGRGTAEVAELMGGLRNKALLEVDESQQPRFTLFESVRDFARTRLQALEQEEEALALHASHYMDRAPKEVALLESREEGQALAWLRAERRNLLAILRHRRGREAASAGLALAAEILHTERAFDASLHLLKECLDAARQGGDPRLLAQTLGYHAAALPLPDYADDAEKELEEALALARAAKDQRIEGRLLLRLGVVKEAIGDADAAERVFTRVTRLARKTDTPLLEGLALVGKQGVANARQQRDEAERLCRASIEILEKHGSVRREAGARVWLATTWAHQGQIGKARRKLLDVVALTREEDLRQVQAYALNNLAALELTVGRLEEAERHGLDALAVQRAFDNRRFRGVLVGNLGLIALERGQLALAESRLREGVWLLEDAGAQLQQAVNLAFLAILMARLSRVSEARATLRKVHELFLESDYRHGLDLLETIEGSIELAEARGLKETDPDRTRRLVTSARERLDARRGDKERHLVNLSEAVRLLEQDLATWEDEIPAPEPPAEERPLLRVGKDAFWFEVEGKGRVDLRRRVALRRLLSALVERRFQAPGEGLETYELFERGWPDVDIHPEAASRRVYLGIWMLRNLGLSDMVLQGDGYLLDPAVRIRVDES